MFYLFSLKKFLNYFEVCFSDEFTTRDANFITDAIDAEKSTKSDKVCFKLQRLVLEQEFSKLGKIDSMLKQFSGILQFNLILFFLLTVFIVYGRHR